MQYRSALVSTTYTRVFLHYRDLELGGRDGKVIGCRKAHDATASYHYVVIRHAVNSIGACKPQATLGQSARQSANLQSKKHEVRRQSWHNDVTEKVVTYAWLAGIVEN